MRSRIGGVELGYEDAGRGRVILLVHGFPLDRTIWSRQIEALSRHGRVIAPDLRGHGTSSAPDGVYAMEDLARDLLGLMDFAGVERFAAAGHSMGGYVLLAMHRIAERRLTAVGLISSRATADSPEAAKSREETAAKVLREGVSGVVESMTAKLFGPSADPDLVKDARTIMSRARPAGVSGALRGMAGRPDSTPHLSAIHVPALVLAGREDRIIPPSESEAMARAIPKARLAWCPKSGHMPMMEEPDLVTEALGTLLNPSADAAGAAP